MPAWLDALAACDRAGQPAVLVTLLSARGSTPREAGCKMLVVADAQYGTIGGGTLEYRCTGIARAMLEGTAGPRVQDFPLGPALGQCCGGAASVLFEPLRPPDWHIAIFGAGHVGTALVRLLADLPCRVAWRDSRPGALPADPPANVVARPLADPAQAVMELAPGSAVLVMTHDHALDFELVAAALARPDFPFVGLIGSATKRARFLRRLAASGLPAGSIARLVCPIGLHGVGGKLPAEIALSVAAQLLQARGQAQPPIAAQGAAQGAAQEPAMPPTAACAGCTVPGR